MAKLAKQDGMHAVGGTTGLYLSVAGNHRAWTLRYMRDGKRHDFSLGAYADFTLVEARERAREQRRNLTDGIDPIQQRRALKDARRAAEARRMSFDDCVKGYLETHGDGWKNAKHRAQWESTITTYASPLIGKLDVRDIDTEHVLKVLSDIWRSKTETASRLRGRIESVLAWATARKFRDGPNPARWRKHLDQLLAKPSKVTKVEHHPALPHREMSTFMAELRKQEGIGAAALEFLILAAARSGEVRGATWDEFDIEAGMWRIPGERMKAGKEHTVPLSDAALAVVDRMKQLRINNHVFPGAREGSPISDMTMTAVLRRMGYTQITTHGMRSSFRMWVADETAYPHEMAEFALAHAIPSKTAAAYLRSTMVAKRRRMMTDWATHCETETPISADLTPIRKVAR